MSKCVINAGWDDAPHLSEDAKQKMLGSYMPHERDARSKGIPSLGAGAIYPVEESLVTCEPFIIPDWYRQVYALDVGWNRTAALWGALDPESDVLYLYSEHYQGEEKPPVHATAIKARGDWIHGVFDPAARGRSQDDGESLYRQYVKLGLRLTQADNAVESGLLECWTRLASGRLKAFRTLQNWLFEFRLYRRDEKGKIVKDHDHLMDCMRYLVMTGLRVARMRPVEMTQLARNAQKRADPMTMFSGGR